MDYHVSDAIEKMVGKKIASVKLSQDKERVSFLFQDGHERSFGVEGDCCSSSWIEHLEVPNNISGAVLTGVEESMGEETDEKVLAQHDCLAVYQVFFHTDKGDIVLEFRNDSNGYYGGYLTL